MVIASLRKTIEFKSLSKLPFQTLLKSMLTYQQQKTLDTLLPLKLELPNGRAANLEYQEDGKVVLSVRMQELYGLKEHPYIMRGKIPIICEILSPAQRPIQTTMDLPRFWKGSYSEVKKEMRGRYPKHRWPDDPSVG